MKESGRFRKNKCHFCHSIPVKESHSTIVSAIGKNNLNVADAPEGFSPHHKPLIIIFELKYLF
jgi:hypothetical protein